MAPILGKIDPDGVEVDELESHLLGHSPHEVGLGDQFPGGEDTRNALARLAMLLEHRLHFLE
jgi:hypothetical protein